MARTSASVLMLALGGTIAMTSDTGGDGVVPTLTGEQLIAAVPGLADTGVDVQVHTFRQLPGASTVFWGGRHAEGQEGSPQGYPLAQRS